MSSPPKLTIPGPGNNARASSSHGVTNKSDGSTSPAATSGHTRSSSQTLASSSIAQSSTSKSTATTDILLSGYLDKLSPKTLLTMTTWQRRYFVLSQVNEKGVKRFELKYYKSNDPSEEVLGNVPIANTISVSVSTEGGWRFELEAIGRVYKFKAASAGELEKWVTALGKTIAKESVFAMIPKDPAAALKSKVDEGGQSAAAALDVLKAMKDGATFIKYSFNFNTKEADKKSVHVFYRSTSSKELGFLCWKDVDEVTKQPISSAASRLVHMSYLHGVKLGKTSLVFQDGIATAANPANCFTLTFRPIENSPAPSKGLNSEGLLEVNLEGESKEQIALWLFGINSIMMTKGVNYSNTSVSADGASKQYTKEEGEKGGDKEKEKEKEKPKESAESSKGAAKEEDASKSESKSTELPLPGGRRQSYKRGSITYSIKLPPGAVPTIGGSAGKPTSSASNAPSLPSASSTSSPSSLSSLDRFDEMRDLLTSLGVAYEGYFTSFKDNGVDINFLLNCTDLDFEDLGVSSKLHRKRLLHEIDRIRAKKGLPPRPRAAVEDKDDALPEEPQSPKSPTKETAASSSSRSGANESKEGLIQAEDDFEGGIVEERVINAVFMRAARSADSVMFVINDFHVKKEKIPIISTIKAKLLAAEVKSRAPKIVLEIGTYIGYTSLCIASALPAGSHLYSIESNPLRAAIATKIVEFAGLSDKVTIIVGTLESRWKFMQSQYGIKEFQFIFFGHSPLRFVKDFKLVEMAQSLGMGCPLLCHSVEDYKEAKEFVDAVSTHHLFESKYVAAKGDNMQDIPGEGFRVTTRRDE